MNAEPENRPDPLSSILLRADAATPPPPLQAGLADEVRRLSRRRRTRRRIGAGIGLAVVIAASAVAILQSSRGRSGDVRWTKATNPKPPTMGTDTGTAPTVEVDYGRVKREADARVASAYHLLAADQRRQRVDVLNARLADAAPTQTDRVQSLRAAAAVTLISRADRLNSRAGSPRDALAAYQRAVELFPDTPWVAVARQRMEELQSQIRKQETPI